MRFDPTPDGLREIGDYVYATYEAARAAFDRATEAYRTSTFVLARKQSVRNV